MSPSTGGYYDSLQCPLAELDGNPNEGDGMNWKKSLVKVLSGLLMLGALAFL